MEAFGEALVQLNLQSAGALHGGWLSGDESLEVGRRLAGEDTAEREGKRESVCVLLVEREVINQNGWTLQILEGKFATYIIYLWILILGLI